jgi:sugar (pentulose or hexulose) kinase
VLLGLDLGTTNIKALLADRSGCVLAQGSAPIHLNYIDDGGIEQDIEEIWQAVIKAVRSAGQQKDLSSVSAVGISSQGGAIQIRDEGGQSIGPVISWLDPRGGAYDRQLENRLGGDWLSQHIGHGQSGLSAGQLARLKEQHPDWLQASHLIGFVGDAIVERFTGKAVHDASSLSIACLCNPDTGQMDEDFLRELGLADAKWPNVQPARQPAGHLKAEVAQQLGLPAGIAVSPAVHDQYAAALGCNALRPADVMFGAGTAWVLLAVADRALRPVVPSAWVCPHLVPQRWGQLLSLGVGGSVIQWALELTGLSQIAASEVDDLIASVQPGCEGMHLLPFLSVAGGEGGRSGGRLDGLLLNHGRAHLVRAAVEGLCFELTRRLNWLEEANCPVHRLIMTGGAAKSRCTPQMISDITGREVMCPSVAEVSAFGALVLARAMIETETELEQLAEEMEGDARTIEPGGNRATYRKFFEDYQQAVSGKEAE